MTGPDTPFFPNSWRARWIWFETPRIEGHGQNVFARRAASDARTGLLRRSFRLDGVPDRASARVTADSRYVLWLNGVEIARGPVRANPRRLHYDVVDLAPHLRPGTNTLAVMVRYFGGANPWWMPAPATLQLGAGAFVFEARLGETWLVSDGEWKALAPAAFEDLPRAGIGGMPPESVDARALPPGWREGGFDDRDWPAAVSLAANAMGFQGRQEPPSQPYGALRPRPIPLLGCEPRSPQAVRVASVPRTPLVSDPSEQVRADLADVPSWRAVEDAGAPLRVACDAERVALVHLDFGQVVCGTVALELEAEAGTRIDVAATETAPDPSGVPAGEEHAGFRYVARGSEDRFETFSPLGFRWLTLAIRADEPVRLDRVALNERLYPHARSPSRGETSAAFFACSDPLLEEIWRVGRRSVDLNSHDAYLDCPTREQRAWTGDFVVHQMVDFTTAHDWRLAVWNVELAASPRADGMLPMAVGGDVEHYDTAYIPDWALHWIHALHNLWRYTGDRERVRSLLPVAEGVLHWLEAHADGEGVLGDVTGWVIVDWSSVSVVGQSATLNALYARALLEVAEMSAWLGDAGRADWARGRHARLRAGFERFWDADRGLYVDHVVGGERQSPLSQHSQAGALVAGLVPPERVAGVVDAMLDTSRHVHATWSRAHGDARTPAPGEHGVGGPYLVAGPPAPWWDVERQIVVAQPFFRYVVHDAVSAAGRSDLIPSLCRDWAALLERCRTSWAETWYGGTTCHGWGSTPTRDLMTRTLGVEPGLPGYATARVAPRLGDLAWARGRVPTPAGPIEIEVRPDRIEVASPVPLQIDPGWEAAPSLARSPGRHVLERKQEGRAR